MAQLQFVLLHELEHVARRDVLVEAATRLLRLGWLFNPGVWIASAAHARWREYACDEAALARSGALKRVPVADALFTLIDFSNDTPRPAGAFAHLLSPRAFMKNRLNRILDRARTPRRSLSGTSVLAVVLVSVGALTAARAQQSQPSQPEAILEEIEIDESAGAPVTATDDVGVVLDQARAWLLQNQQADGRWATSDDPEISNQRDHNEVHVTGLAVRALIAGLSGPRHGEIVRAIERGAAFLEQSQRESESGRFGPYDAFTMMYGHGQALRALCAVQRVFPDKDRLERIELGVRYAEQARNPYMGWRYTPRSGDNDSKITALMLLALREAANLGIEVDEQAFRCGRETLNQLTLEETGRTGFVQRGQTMSRFTSKKDDFPGELSEEPTAMTLLVRFAFGEKIVESKATRRAVVLLTELPPEWSRERGSIDYSYWSFGAQALAQVGGHPAELWRERLHRALLPNRIEVGGAVHWPPVDAWSHPGMEAYATATAVLALQALR